MNIVSKLRYKLWFLRLPQLIKEKKWRKGAEIGVKAGRSYFRCLRRNPELQMIGVDLWEDEPGSPYARNTRNGAIAQQRNMPYARRSTLLKGDARTVAENIPDNSLDFVFYDVYNFRISSTELHRSIMGAWIGKLKPGGYFIGRDFHNDDIQEAIRHLTKEPVKPLPIHGKEDIRLKYFVRQV